MIDLPAMKLTSDKRGLVPLNMKVKDSIWPGRDMIDLTVLVRPNKARTLWLDMRDQMPPHDSLYLAIASAAPYFGATSLDGAPSRLVFKPRDEAAKKHVAGRFNQVKDNWCFLVEEHTAPSAPASMRDYSRMPPICCAPIPTMSKVALIGSTSTTVGVPAAGRAAAGAGGRTGLGALATAGYEAGPPLRRMVDPPSPGPYGDFGGSLSDDSAHAHGLASMQMAPSSRSN